MSKVKMISDSNREIARNIIKAMEDSPLMREIYYQRLDYREAYKVVKRLESGEDITEKMFRELLSFARDYFGITPPNSVEFISEE